MFSRTAAIVLLCATLLFSLAACAPAIKTDESTWNDAITLGVTESTASATDTTASGSTVSSVSSTASAATAPTSGTTESRSSTTTVKTTAGAVANADSSVGYVNASTLNVRSGPGSNYEAIGGLQRGDQVNITGRSGDWYVIRFGDGEAYVSAQYISSTPVE